MDLRSDKDFATINQRPAALKIAFKHAKMEKLKNENSKNALLKKPPHPTNSQGFIVYMSIASTKLVECKISEKRVSSYFTCFIVKKSPPKSPQKAQSA